MLRLVIARLRGLLMRQDSLTASPTQIVGPVRLEPMIRLGRDYSVPVSKPLYARPAAKPRSKPVSQTKQGAKLTSAKAHAQQARPSGALGN